LEILVCVKRAGDVSSACRAASTGDLHEHSGNGSAGQGGSSATKRSQPSSARVAAFSDAVESSSEVEDEEEDEEEQEDSSVSKSSEEEETETPRIKVSSQRREYLQATSGKKADKDPFLSAWYASACMDVRLHVKAHIQRRWSFCVCEGKNYPCSHKHL
jgi:hypothetical protein